VDQSPARRRRLAAARGVHAGVAAVIAISLIVQLVLLFEGGTDADSGHSEAAVAVGTRLVRFFSYFTIESNLVVLAVSVTLAARPERDGRAWRVARLDALLGIVISASAAPPAAPATSSVARSRVCRRLRSSRTRSAASGRGVSRSSSSRSSTLDPPSAMLMSTIRVNFVSGLPTPPCVRSTGSLTAERCGSLRAELARAPSFRRNMAYPLHCDNTNTVRMAQLHLFGVSNLKRKEARRLAGFL